MSLQQDHKEPELTEKQILLTLKARRANHNVNIALYNFWNDEWNRED
jgi:hypothetical protein